eukprot:2328782-Heterocapsa_arctica.AAC.1
MACGGITGLTVRLVRRRAPPPGVWPHEEEKRLCVVCRARRSSGCWCRRCAVRFALVEGVYSSIHSCRDL